MACKIGVTLHTVLTHGTEVPTYGQQIAFYKNIQNFIRQINFWWGFFLLSISSLIVWTRNYVIKLNIFLHQSFLQSSGSRWWISQYSGQPLSDCISRLHLRHVVSIVSSLKTLTLGNTGARCPLTWDDCLSWWWQYPGASMVTMSYNGSQCRHIASQLI